MSDANAPTPLAAAIAARDPDTFFERLEDVDAATRDVPLARLPESLRMVRVLFYLQMDMDPELGGIERFLLETPEEVGAYASDAERWCRGIGANRIADYVARAIALFPGGEVPAEWGQRVELVGDTVSSDALEALDAEFADARPELAARLRAHFESHRRELEAAIIEAAGTAGEMWALPAVLEIEDPVQFLEGLYTMIEREGVPVYAELRDVPPDVLVVRILLALYLTVGADGIWKFLAEQETGGYLPRARDWCRAIGARRAAEYLGEVAALFPRGEVPADDDERWEALERIEDEWSRKRASNPADPALRYPPLTAIDRAFEGAMDEMTDALRAYLRARAADVREARAALARVAEARP